MTSPHSFRNHFRTALGVSIVTFCALLATSGTTLAADAPTTQPTSGPVIKVVGVTASHSESKAAGGFADFPPEKTLDGDLTDKSSWRAEVKDEKTGQWITYDLGTPQQLTAIRLLFVKGQERAYRFSVALSSDAREWTTVLEKTSSKQQGFETFTLQPATARYLRITGWGNSDNKFGHWVNIIETQILGK